MKKVVKILASVFVYCVLLSASIPKGPNIEKLPEYNDCNEWSKYVIYVDFSKSSCSDRLFIYDVGVEPELIYSGVVLHGCGGKSTPSKPEFSNEIGSNCSSLGEYTLEGTVRMKNGMEAIKLKGWSDTNSNAEARNIYIHPCTMATLLPFNLPGLNFPLTKASEGCFAVSYHTYDVIKYCMNKDIEIDDSFNQIENENRHDRTKLKAFYYGKSDNRRMERN